MRANHMLTLGLVLVLTMLGSGVVFRFPRLRDNVRDVLEVFRTYATFGLLQLELYAYPLLEEQAEATKPPPKLAPKILHQLILREARNTSFAKYESAHRSCLSVHPDWEHTLWTDDNATSFVSTNHPGVLPHYENYAQTIQRTNVLRYLLLHHYGGVYLDLDITCRVPLDTLLHMPFLTPSAYPVGINNAFMLARPQHPLLREAILRIPSRDNSWALPYVENMLTTGCMFFTNAWMDYIRKSRDLEWQDKVFVLADQHRRLESHMLRGQVTTPLAFMGRRADLVRRRAR
jgi:mannosyltransferase OCH1-like enzyme